MQYTNKQVATLGYVLTLFVGQPPASKQRAVRPQNRQRSVFRLIPRVCDLEGFHAGDYWRNGIHYALGADSPGNASDLLGDSSAPLTERFFRAIGFAASIVIDFDWPLKYERALIACRIHVIRQYNQADQGVSGRDLLSRPNGLLAILLTTAHERILSRGKVQDLDGYFGGAVGVDVVGFTGVTAAVGSGFTNRIFCSFHEYPCFISA